MDKEINTNVLDGIPSYWKAVLSVTQEEIDAVVFEKPIEPEDKKIGVMTDFQKACWLIVDQQSSILDSLKEKSIPLKKQAEELKKQVEALGDTSKEILDKVNSLNKEAKALEKEANQIHPLLSFAHKALKKSIFETYPGTESVVIRKGGVLVQGEHPLGRLGKMLESTLREVFGSR